MATCNNVTIIFDSECVGESLSKINTNFANLDTGLCELGQDLLNLDAFVRSLRVVDTPTIDMSFSLTDYALSASVVDNSLGTSKLGVDIPDTTKVFLTAAKISSLLDTNIVSPLSGQLLIWNGEQWNNAFLPDAKGATILDELGDVTLTAPLLNGQILKFDETANQWVNGADSTELTVKNGNYGDITVGTGEIGLGPDGRGGPGTMWNINPGKVGTDELKDNAVTNSKIKNLAITNDKIADNTIQLSKCAFGVGEVNTGANIGDGVGIFAQKNGVALEFKSLVASGAVSLQATNDTITINVPTVSAPLGATGENLGTGVGIYSTQQSTNGNLKFKKIKAGVGISITELDNEIVISASRQILGLSIIGVDENGNTLTSSQVIPILNSIYPASSFPISDSGEKTLCRVEVALPGVELPTNYNVSVPVTIKYTWNGNKNNVGSQFNLTQPAAVQTGTNVIGALDEYTGTETYTGTATAQGSSKFKIVSRTIFTYQSNGSSWEPL